MDYTSAALRGYGCNCGGDEIYNDAALRGYGDEIYNEAALRGYGKRPHLVKGSPEAKAFMARLRAMRTGKRGGGKKRGGIALGTIGAILGLAPTVISGARALYDAIKGKKGGRDIVNSLDERDQWIATHKPNGQWTSVLNSKGKETSAKYYAPYKTMEANDKARRKRLNAIPNWFMKIMEQMPPEEADELFSHYPSLVARIRAEVPRSSPEAVREYPIITPSRTESRSSSTRARKPSTRTRRNNEAAALRAALDPAALATLNELGSLGSRTRRRRQ